MSNTCCHTVLEIHRELFVFSLVSPTLIKEDFKRQNTAWICRCIGTYKSIFPIHTNTCPNVLFAALSLNSTHTYCYTAPCNKSVVFSASQKLFYVYFHVAAAQLMYVCLVNHILHFPECLFTFPRDKVYYCMIELRN